MSSANQMKYTPPQLRSRASCIGVLTPLFCCSGQQAQEVLHLIPPSHVETILEEKAKKLTTSAGCPTLFLLCFLSQVSIFQNSPGWPVLHSHDGAICPTAGRACVEQDAPGVLGGAHVSVSRA
jgi:hypothetical protein